MRTRLVAGLAALLLALVGALLPAGAASAATTVPPQVMVVSDVGSADVSVLWRKVAGAASYELRLYQVLDSTDRRKGSFAKGSIRLLEVRRSAGIRPSTSSATAQSLRITKLREQSLYLAKVWVHRTGAPVREIGIDFGITGTKSRYLRCALPLATMHIVKTWSKSSLLTISMFPGLPAPVKEAAARGGQVVDFVEVAVTPNARGEYAVKVGTQRVVDKHGTVREKKVVGGLMTAWDALALAQEGVGIADTVDATCR